MEMDFRDSLVLTGGGTGGHYYPAIALAEAAQGRWPSRPIVFIGAKRGIEAKKLPQSCWQHLLLDVEGFNKRSPLKALKAAWRMFAAIRHLRAVWRKQRPMAVIGTGGYASGPALLAAKSLNIPYFIHESNAKPGLIARLAANKAQRVWLGMGSAKARLPKANCIYVGTPVRAPFLREFSPYTDLHSQKPLTLLVLGGSGGARAINAAMLSIAGALLEKHTDWKILHQTGNLDIQQMNKVPRHSMHTLAAFIEDMDTAMESASLVLSRAGASTCSELKAAGRPAVLVPLPISAGGHQKHNAQVFVSEKRGIMVEQGRDFNERLFDALSSLMGDIKARESLSKPEPNSSVIKCLDDMKF